MTSSLSPPRVGQRVYLRPVQQVDYELIRAMETAGDSLVLYRHRGTTPSPEEFVARLWQGVMVQFMICHRSTRTPMGLVAAYNADHKNATAYLACIVFPEFRMSGWPLEGAQLFIDYLFDAFPLRKLYAESIAPNAAQFATASPDIVQVEGRLKAHEYFKGSYHDMVIMAIYRSDWENRHGDGGQPRRGSSLAEHLRRSFGAPGSPHAI